MTADRTAEQATSEQTTGNTTMRAVVQDVYGPTRGRAPPRADRPGPRSAPARCCGGGGGGRRPRGLAPDGRQALRDPAGRVRVRVPKNRVRGSEFAGRVEAVGADVTTAAARATRSSGSAPGPSPSTWSARCGKVAPKPANLTFEQAAAMPVSAPPPCRRCATRARCSPGQKVLVIGASGGVGSSPSRSRRRSAPRSPACAAPPRWTSSAPSGADRRLDYTAGDFLPAVRRYDVVLDIGGNTPPAALRRAADPDGNPGHRRRRGRRALAGNPPSAAGHGAVAVRRPEARHVHQLRECGRSRGPDRAGRVRPGHTRRRPHVPAGRGAGGRAPCAWAGLAARSSSPSDPGRVDREPVSSSTCIVSARTRSAAPRSRGRRTGWPPAAPE